MTTRRGFLASSLAAVVALAGCTEQSGITTTRSPTSETTTDVTVSDTTTPPTATTETSTADDTETTAIETTDATDEESPFDPPELNRTPYPVSWEWAMSGDALDDHVAVVTSNDWREKVDEAPLSAKSRSFLSETDFDAETVVAFQMHVAAGYNRFILHSVDGVGTKTIELTISEWQSGSGLNNSPTHLLLVRVPNRGTEPAEVEITAPQTTTAG